MTTWKKLLSVFGALALVIAMGAGCVVEDNANTVNDNEGGVVEGNNSEANNNTDNEDDDDYTTDACPSGTKRFVSAKESLTFCYPEQVGDDAVTIDDAVNSVTLKVGDEVVRVLMVEKVDVDVDRGDKVLAYAANPDDDAITCEAQSVEDENGRETFILVGKQSGVQGADAVSACVDSTALNNALNDEPVGKFFFYENEDELIIVSGSQDAVLGQLTDEFEATIWPKS
jgi:hypothetical protein